MAAQNPDPELELLARAEALVEKSIAKNPKAPLGMRAAMQQVAAADPELGRRVMEQRKKSPGPTIKVDA